MAPPPTPLREFASTSALCARHVTEDTPADLLEGTMDLTVILPQGHSVRMNVHRSTAMMDLLIQVTTAHKINPGGHVIHVVSENRLLSYKPSTPIGSLDTSLIEIVPKNRLNEGSKQRRSHLTAQALEKNIRLKVNLPKSQLAVYRVPPKTLISDIFSMVCRDRCLDMSKHEIIHPLNVDEKLRGSCTLADYQLQEVCVVSRDYRAPPLSVTDLITMATITHPQDKKSRGLFSFFTKKNKSSLGGSSLSSDSAGERSVSPARSDDLATDAAAQQPPPLQSAQNVKYRTPAPVIPVAKPRKKKAPPPPPPPSKEHKNGVCQSAKISEKSLKTEAAFNSEPNQASPSGSEVSSTEATHCRNGSTNLTQVTSSSTLSLTSSKGKRRAPQPPQPPRTVLRGEPETPRPSAIPEEAELPSVVDKRESSAPVTSKEGLDEPPEQSHPLCRSSSPASSHISSVSSLSSADPQTPQEMSSPVPSPDREASVTPCDQGPPVSSDQSPPVPPDQSPPVPPLDEGPLVQPLEQGPPEPPLVGSQVAPSDRGPPVPPDQVPPVPQSDRGTIVTPSDEASPVSHLAECSSASGEQHQTVESSTSTTAALEPFDTFADEEMPPASIVLEKNLPMDVDDGGGVAVLSAEAKVNGAVGYSWENGLAHESEEGEKDEGGQTKEEARTKEDESVVVEGVNCGPSKNTSSLKSEEATVSRGSIMSASSDVFDSRGDFDQCLNESENILDAVAHVDRCFSEITDEDDLSGKDDSGIKTDSREEPHDSCNWEYRVPAPPTPFKDDLGKNTEVKDQPTIASNDASMEMMNRANLIYSAIEKEGCLLDSISPAPDSGHSSRRESNSSDESSHKFLERDVKDIVIEELKKTLKESKKTEPRVVSVSPKTHVVLEKKVLLHTSANTVESPRDSSSTYDSCNSDHSDSSSKHSSISSYESAPPPVPDSAAPTTEEGSIAAASNEIAVQADMEGMKSEPSVHKEDNLYYTRRFQPMVFSISTYASRSAEERTYDKKLTKSESFNNKPKPEVPQHKPTLTKADSFMAQSRPVQSYRSSTSYQTSSWPLKEERRVLRKVREDEDDLTTDQIVRPSVAASRRAYWQNREQMEQMGRASSLLDLAPGSPNLRKAQSSFDVSSSTPLQEPMFGLIPESGLAKEYARLQEGFFKWQQQLLDNQHVLHSRVAPLAANPIQPSSLTEPFVEARNPVLREVNIPIRIEGSDDVVSDTDSYSYCSQTLPRQRLTQSVQDVRRDAAAAAVGLESGQTRTLRPGPPRQHWQETPAVSVGAWNERPAFPPGPPQPQYRPPSERARSFQDLSGGHDGSRRSPPRPLLAPKPFAKLQESSSSGPDFQRPPQSAFQQQHRPVETDSRAFSSLDEDRASAAFWRELQSRRSEMGMQEGPVAEPSSQRPQRRAHSVEDERSGNRVIAASKASTPGWQGTHAAPRALDRPHLNGDDRSDRYTSVVTLGGGPPQQPARDKMHSIVHLGRPDVARPFPVAPVVRGFRQQGEPQADLFQHRGPDLTQPSTLRQTGHDGGSVTPPPSDVAHHIQSPVSAKLVAAAALSAGGHQRASPPMSLGEPKVNGHSSAPPTSRASPPQSAYASTPYQTAESDLPSLRRHPLEAREDSGSSLKQAGPPPMKARPSAGFYTHSRLNNVDAGGAVPSPPPPPPTSSGAPPAPPPPAERRTASGKKIITAKAAPQLDPREELMLAIRNFGGSRNLRKTNM